MDEKSSKSRKLKLPIPTNRDCDCKGQPWKTRNRKLEEDIL